MNTTIFFIIYILLYKTVVGTVQNSIGRVEWLTLQPYEVPLAFQLPDGLQSSWYIFICRTNYGNNQLVGRLLFHYERIPTCHFAYDGSELNQPDFQVLFRTVPAITPSFTYALTKVALHYEFFSPCLRQNFN